MEIKEYVAFISALTSGGDRPVILGAVTLGVLLGFLLLCCLRVQRLKHKNKQICHPSEHDKLLEYMYDGCPLDPNVYSGQKIDMPDDGHRHTPHSDLQLDDEELDLANRMLTLAVQSYRCPEELEGYRTRNISGLPCVTIFNEELLNKVFKGVLKVRLHCANNLRSVTPLGGYARPYVEAFVAASSFRTDPATRGSCGDPDWDEDHWLYIRDPNYDSLSIRVLGDTAFAKGINLGTAVLGLGGMVENEGREMNFKLPLRGFAGENSTISMTCVFHRFPAPVPTESQRELLLNELKKYQIRENGTSGGSAISEMGIRASSAGSGAGEHANSANGACSCVSQQQELLPVAYVDCGSTETQAWVFWNPAQRKVAVAFRGTEPRLADIITDARFIPCTFETIIQDSRDKLLLRRQDVRVHRGFMHAYRSVRRVLSSLVYALTGPDQGQQAGYWDIHVTGHSLGGALATLAAYELGIFKDYAGNIGSVSLHTYGSPRVGDRAFATEFDQMVPNAWRFTNCADIVPTVPPASVFSYHHVGHPVRLRGDGQVLRGLNSLEEAAERKRLAETPGSASEILCDAVQREMNVLMSALRRGVNHHYGDCYKNNLPSVSASRQQQQQQA